jgi:hypothetical protein
MIPIQEAGPAYTSGELRIKKNKGKTTEARVKTEANRLTKTNPGTRKSHDDKKKRKKEKQTQHKKLKIN